MSKYKIIKLKNLTPLHIGLGKDHYDFSSPTIESDVIIAALSSIRANNGKVDDLDEFMHSFKLSSTFPYMGNRLFLPNTLRRIDIHADDENEALYRKSLKRIQYIEYPLWIEIIKGNTLHIKPMQIKTPFLTNSIDNIPPIYDKQIVQRVMVPRGRDNSSEPFFFEWTYFNNSENCGLYCIIDTNENTLFEIKSLFEQLGEIGIGTDKSVGGGKFDVEISEIDIPDIIDSNATLLLSSYIPQEEELKDIDFQNSSYELLCRNGFMAGSSHLEFRHLRRKKIYMFKSGSILRSHSRLEGKVVNLAPEWNDDKMHPVYRSGCSFLIPIKIN